MAPEPLANLTRIGQLKVEARNPAASWLRPAAWQLRYPQRLLVVAE
jgi:hypothetical protein